MSQLNRRGDVANGVNVGDRGLVMVINLQSPPVQLRSQLGIKNVFQIGRAANGTKYRLPGDRF